MRSPFFCLIVALAACAGPPPAAPAATTTPTPTTEHFRFRVDFWPNLNEVLLHEALLPRPGYEGPKSLKNHHVVQAETLAPAEAAPWKEALAYYDQHFTTNNLFEHFVGAMPVLFALGPTQAPSVTTDLDDEWCRRLVAAAPIYRKHFWPAHEQRARAYIDGIRPRIAAHEAWFAKRLVGVYGVPLPTSPIDVEITPVVPPFGGFTMGDPPYTGANAAMITLSSEDASYAGDDGVEMLFHEVAHLLVGRVQDGLDASAKRQGKKIPPRLWHDVIFYTAGHVAQERLGPGYLPFAERPASKVFEEKDPSLLVLRRAWQPYLDGKVTMEAAIDAVAASF